MARVITWMDTEERYRITSPAYGYLMRRYSEYDEHGVVVKQFTEDDCLDLVWSRIVNSGGYGIPLEHPKHEVEGEVLRAKITTIGGDRSRHSVDLVTGEQVHRWMMASDGTPRINPVEVLEGG